MIFMALMTAVFAGCETDNGGNLLAPLLFEEDETAEMRQYEPENNDATGAVGIPTNGFVVTQTLHISSDVDYFRFRAAVGAEYFIEESANYSPEARIRLEVIDAAGTVLKTNSVNGEDLDGASLQFVPGESGDYYVKVSTAGGYAGQYDLSITVGPDTYEPDNVISSAKEILINGTGQLHTLHPTTGSSGSDSDILHFKGLADFSYRARLEYCEADEYGNNGYDYVFDALQLSFLDNIGTVITTTEESGTFVNNTTRELSCTTPVDGDYYLLVRTSSTTGTYRIVLTVDDDPWEESGDNTIANAPELAVNGAAQRHSLTAGDVDYIKFNAVAGTPYSIRTDSLSEGTDTVIELTSADGVALAANNDGENAPGSQLYWVPGTSSTYYVKVISSAFGLPGTYTIQLETVTGTERIASSGNSIHIHQ